MNQVLKWLNRHEAFVHMVVTFSMFYGVPLTWASVFQPSMFAPIVASAAIGLSLIFLIYGSYWFASVVTHVIRDVVARIALDEIRDTSLDSKIDKPRVVDMESETTMVVANLNKETLEAVENLKQAVTNFEATTAQTVVLHETKVEEPETAVPPQPVEKKKRAPRAKSVKKEA